MIKTYGVFRVITVHSDMVLLIVVFLFAELVNNYKAFSLMLPLLLISKITCFMRMLPGFVLFLLVWVEFRISIKQAITFNYEDPKNLDCRSRRCKPNDRLLFK